MSTDTRPDIFVLIEPTGVDHWLEMLHRMADKMREYDGRHLGARLDLMADEVETCADRKWRDRKGRPIKAFEFRVVFTELPERGLDIKASLRPVRPASSRSPVRRAA
ncbi:MAG: hypothetical protein Q7V57_00865 [Actinomycetota bacterium]|nr:hypothetical protein [Actinomycetota bacterium]